MSELNKYFIWVEDDWGHIVSEQIEVWAENDEETEQIWPPIDDSFYGDENDCMVKIVVPASRCSPERLKVLEQQCST